MKKLIIALVLAMAMVMSLGTPVLAWDEEDPCVADNDDFFMGGSHDYDATPSWQGMHYGDQFFGYGDGCNLYRDDATDTGHLDEVLIMTRTPNKIDLPNTDPYGGGYVEMWDFGSNAWYWATEARGYNYPPVIVPPKPKPNYWLNIILPDASKRFKRQGTTRCADIDFNDGTWRILIPARVQIWDINTSGEYCGAATKLKVDESGNIISNVRYLNTDLFGEVTITGVD